MPLLSSHIVVYLMLNSYSHHRQITAHQHNDSYLITVNDMAINHCCTVTLTTQGQVAGPYSKMCDSCNSAINNIPAITSFVSHTCQADWSIRSDLSVIIVCL